MYFSATNETLTSRLALRWTLLRKILFLKKKDSLLAASRIWCNSWEATSKKKSQNFIAMVRPKIKSCSPSLMRMKVGKPKKKKNIMRENTNILCKIYKSMEIARKNTDDKIFSDKISKLSKSTKLSHSPYGMKFLRIKSKHLFNTWLATNHFLKNLRKNQQSFVLLLALPSAHNTVVRSGSEDPLIKVKQNRFLERSA